MSDEHDEAEAMREDVPSTIARSGDKAVRTYKKTLESAEESYDDDPGRAHRAAFSALRHTHEPKPEKGPSDEKAELSGPESRDSATPTAEGVDANASKKHLVDVATKLGIEHAQRSTKAELGEEIKKANRRETERARKR